jgi:hypothetical protein
VELILEKEEPLENFYFQFELDRLDFDEKTGKLA